MELFEIFGPSKLMLVSLLDKTPASAICESEHQRIGECEVSDFVAEVCRRVIHKPLGQDVRFQMFHVAPNDQALIGGGGIIDVITGSHQVQQVIHGQNPFTALPDFLPE